MGAKDTPLNEEPLFDRQQEALNEIHHLLHAYDCRNTCQDLNIAEGYVQGQFGLLIRCFPDGGLQKLERLVFFDAHPFRRGECHEANTSWSHRDCSSGPQAHHSDENKLYMGVSVFETVEGPEQIIPSEVRLHASDKSLGVGVELLYFSLSRGQFEFIEVPSNREIGAVGAGRSVLARERTSNLVKSIPEIAYYPSRNRGGIDRHSKINFGLEPLIDAIRVRLYKEGNFMSVGFGEIVDGRGEIFDVAIGPFNL